MSVEKTEGLGGPGSIEPIKPISETRLNRERTQPVFVPEEFPVFGPPEDLETLREQLSGLETQLISDPDNLQIKATIAYLRNQMEGYK